MSTSALEAPTLEEVLGRWERRLGGEAAVAEELVAATGYGEAARLNAVWAHESAGEGLVESPMPSQVLPGSAAALLLSPPIASPLSADDGPRLYVPTDEIVNEIASMRGPPASRPPPIAPVAATDDNTSRLSPDDGGLDDAAADEPPSLAAGGEAAAVEALAEALGQEEFEVVEEQSEGLDSLLRTLRDQIVATDYVEQQRAAAPPPPPPPPAEEEAEDEDDDLDFDLVSDDGPPDEKENFTSSRYAIRSCRPTTSHARPRRRRRRAARRPRVARPLPAATRAGRSASLEEFVALEQEATAAAAAAAADDDDDDDDFALVPEAGPPGELGDLLRTLRDQIVATDYVEQQKAREAARAAAPRRHRRRRAGLAAAARGGGGAGLAGAAVVERQPRAAARADPSPMRRPPTSPPPAFAALAAFAASGPVSPARARVAAAARRPPPPSPLSPLSPVGRTPPSTTRSLPSDARRRARALPLPPPLVAAVLWILRHLGPRSLAVGLGGALPSPFPAADGRASARALAAADGGGRGEARRTAR